MSEEYETGAGTGDARENSPDAAGYTDEQDRLFRSHFQNVNHLADRAYDDVRPAYRLGYEAAVDPLRSSQSFADLEKDLENGWLNVRTRSGEWASVRDYAREGFERGLRLGFVKLDSDVGETPPQERPPFADPLADGIDPTAPESPEQTLQWQREEGAPPPRPSADQGDFGHESPGEARE